jgi:hypothetical protein
MLSIVCNVLGIVFLTGAVFLWPTNIPHVHFITLALGVSGAILLVIGILFHVSDSMRHKGRIRELERRWEREERAWQREDADPEPEAEDQEPGDSNKQS